jgi:hypothetical protein
MEVQIMEIKNLDISLKKGKDNNKSSRKVFNTFCSLLMHELNFPKRTWDSKDVRSEQRPVIFKLIQLANEILEIDDGKHSFNSLFQVVVDEFRQNKRKRARTGIWILIGFMNIF